MKIPCKKFSIRILQIIVSSTLVSRFHFIVSSLGVSIQNIYWKNRLFERDSSIDRSRLDETEGKRTRRRLLPRRKPPYRREQTIAGGRLRRCGVDVSYPMRNYLVACGAVLKHLSNDAFPYTRVTWSYTRSSLVHNSVPVYTSRCLPCNVLVTAPWSPKQDPSWV